MLASPAERLNGHAQILLEIDGILNVEAIHIEIALCAVKPVGVSHLVHAGIGCGELDIMTVHIKIIRAADVILGARAADGREVGVAVDEELDLALTPPAVGLDTPEEIGADITAASVAMNKTSERSIGISIKLSRKNLFCSGSSTSSKAEVGSPLKSCASLSISSKTITGFSTFAFISAVMILPGIAPT